MTLLLVGLIALLAILGSLPRVGDYLPARLTGWGMELVAGGSAQAWIALWVTLALIGAALGTACLSFRAQEL